MSQLLQTLICTFFASACAVPSDMPKPATAPATKSEMPCALELEDHRGMVTARATLSPSQDLTGNFDMTLRHNSASGTIDMSQGGHFDLSAGERATLNEATLNGRARDIDAALTLRTKSGRIHCPVVVNGTVEKEI